MVEAIFVRLAFELELKKLADRFAAEMDKVKDGDFSVMLTSKDYGILGPVAATVNTVLSDIRNLIDGFFSWHFLSEVHPILLIPFQKTPPKQFS